MFGLFMSKEQLNNLHAIATGLKREPLCRS